MKDSFCGEVERAFDQFLKHHIQMLLEDFNAKVGREDIFKPKIQNESLHETSNDNGVRLVDFVKSTMFAHCKMHKYTWTSPDRKTRNQIDHELIDRRRKSSILDVRFLEGQTVIPTTSCKT
jgi:hypothetical protein